MNRHLKAVADGKAAALGTFRLLVPSIEEPEVRSAVAHALAQAVFTVESTGLVDGSNDRVTLVEQALAPRLGGSGSV